MMSLNWRKTVVAPILFFFMVGIAFLVANVWKNGNILKDFGTEKETLLMPHALSVRDKQVGKCSLVLQDSLESELLPSLQEQQGLDSFPISFDCYAGPDFQEAVAHNYIDSQFELTTIGSTVEMIEQSARYEALWRTEINRSLAALENLLYQPEYDLLIQAQDEWEKYVDSCFTFDVSLYRPLSPYGIGGSFARDAYTAEKARKVKERAVALWGYRYALTFELDFIIEGELATILN